MEDGEVAKRERAQENDREREGKHKHNTGIALWLAFNKHNPGWVKVK